MSFSWRDEYAIGVKIIDEQHKILIGILSELDDIRKNPDSSALLQSDLVQRLEHYVKIHFTTEEEIMRIYKVEAIEDHKALHAAFSSKIRAFREHLSEERSFFFGKMYQYLEGWLLNHIQSEDKLMGPYLNSQGLK